MVPTNINAFIQDLKEKENEVIRVTGERDSLRELVKVKREEEADSLTSDQVAVLDDLAPVEEEQPAEKEVAETPPKEEKPSPKQKLKR